MLRYCFVFGLVVSTGCSVDRSGLFREGRTHDDLGVPTSDFGVGRDTGAPVDFGGTEPDLSWMPPDLGPRPDAGCDVNGCASGLTCAPTGVCDMPPPPCGVEGSPCCAGDTCSASLTCGPAGTCEACNHAGADCCGGDRCDDPFVCAFDVTRWGNDCQTCGGYLEPCCPGDRCDGGLGCGPLTGLCR